MENKNTYAIVIGRQFGCGGREIGKIVAKKLGVSYYDSEIVLEAAKNSGVNKDLFEAADERSPKYFGGIFSLGFNFGPGAYLMGSSPVGEDSIYQEQANAILQIADRGPCVIVGRTADYILRNHCKVISIFIHASINDRVQRIISRGDCDNTTAAKQLAEKNNKLRANYYNFYTDRSWGAADTYDLTINASALGDEGTADTIVEYVKKSIK